MVNLTGTLCMMKIMIDLWQKEEFQHQKKMGIFIAERHEIPDLVISSPAIRTQDTAKLAIKAGGWDTVSTLTLSDYLYLASKHTIISLLSKQKEIYSSICIVGHEPSMSSFINNQTEVN